MEEEVEVIVGAYRLTGQLGSATSTFFAEHKNTNDLSVVKFFRGDRVTPKLWSKVSSILKAPSQNDGVTCKISEAGFVHGEIYVAAPYLHGATLAQLVKGLSRRRDLTLMPLHERTVAWMIAELARILMIRGNESVQHPLFESDLIAPGEFFVLYSGELRALDARWTWLRALATGEPLGSLESSLAYKAPTDMRSSKRAPDTGRAWALSVLLWELLVGYRLFRRDTLDLTLEAIQQSEVPDPRVLNPRISKEMGQFVQRALSRTHTVSLKEIEEKMRRLAQVEAEPAKIWVQSLMNQLFPDELVGISTKQKIEKTQTLDAFLEEQVTRHPDDSTTCIVTPPSEQASRVAQLSWLEDDASPRLRPLAAPADKHKKFGVSSSVLVVLACGFGSYFAVEAALERNHGANSSTTAAMSLNPWRERTDKLSSPPAASNEERSAARPEPSPVIVAPTVEASAANALPPANSTPLQNLLDLDTAPHASASEREPVASPNVNKGAPLLTKELAAPEGTSSVPNPSRTNDDTLRVANTGDLLVNAPAGSKVYRAGDLLGTGKFSVRLPVGEHLLKVEAPSGRPSYVVARVRPGTMAILDMSNSMP